MSTSSAHAELVRQIPTSYEKAVTSGDLLFFPSTVHKHVDVDVEVSCSVPPFNPSFVLKASNAVV